MLTNTESCVWAQPDPQERMMAEITAKNRINLFMSGSFYYIGQGEGNRRIN